MYRYGNLGALLTPAPSDRRKPRVMTARDAPAPDPRQRPRPRTAMSGQILYGMHRETADVVVRNLTDGGAKVRLSAAAGVRISDRVVLRIAAVDRVGIVAWRSGNEVGLRFE